MDKPQSDLVVRYKLETEFFHNHVRHTRYLEKARDRTETVREGWSNCGELGKGGFGVVRKQIQKATGRYRAIKTIDKRLSHRFDYSRELLVMAILAKYPSLFVEFPGWFEEPETLYIAMEYLEEGDLTKHIGIPLPQETVRKISKQILEGLEVMHREGITHRDLKPANIFVVRMSPVWVKLGDFGISKRILAHDTTALRTQVSTQAYGAPEVLGLDSNSETSVYTNSVDIWSLGCVVYELLVGTKLFVSEGQVFRYYIGKFPFPEGKLKALSPPVDDVGISFLESMLVIQPEDRPTATSALRHAWLVCATRGNSPRGDDQNETTHCRDEKTLSDKSGSKIVVHDRRTKWRSDGSPISQVGAECAPQDAASKEDLGSQRGSDPITLESPIDTFVLPPPDITSFGISRIQAAPLTSGLMPHDFQAAHYKGPRPPRKSPIYNISQTRKRKRTKPPPPFLMRLRPKLPTNEPTLLDRAGSSHTIRICRRTKSRGIPRPKAMVGETAETQMSRPSIRRKTLTPGETLILASVLVAILMLAEIRFGILVRGGTPGAEEIEISDGIQTRY